MNLNHTWGHHAQSILDNDYVPHPVNSITKSPIMEWKNVPDWKRAWMIDNPNFAECGVGIRLGYGDYPIIEFDFDMNSPALKDVVIGKLRNEHEDLWQDGIVIQGNPMRFKLFCRCYDLDGEIGGRDATPTFYDGEGNMNVMEIRFGGHQSVVMGEHKEGGCYRNINGNDFVDTDAGRLMVIEPGMVKVMDKLFADACIGMGMRATKRSVGLSLGNKGPGRKKRIGLRATYPVIDGLSDMDMEVVLNSVGKDGRVWPHKVGTIVKFCEFVPVEDWDDFWVWSKLTSAMIDLVRTNEGKRDVVMRLWNAVSRVSQRYDMDMNQWHWDQLEGKHEGYVNRERNATLGSIKAIAIENGYQSKSYGKWNVPKSITEYMVHAKSSGITPTYADYLTYCHGRFRPSPVRTFNRHAHTHQPQLTS